jgi:predicted O-methyltransferase YrrM
MNKLKKIYKAAGLLMRKPYLINKIIDDNNAWLKRVERDFGMQKLPEVNYHDLSKSKEITVSPFAFMEGGSLPTDLALLRILAARYDKCTYFEIGTWRGESVANVAEVAAECTTMNLSAKEMKGFGLTQDYIDQHAMFSRDLPNVIHLEGNSLEFDFVGLNKKYDLIFIDGDHHFESIKKDTENIFRHLVHDKSIVVWHDYAFQPSDVRFETMAAILTGMPARYRDRVYSVRNTICAIYSPDVLFSEQASNIARAGDVFELRINKK